MLRPSDAEVPLWLIETHTFGNGVVLLRYQRRNSSPAAGDPVGPPSALG